MKRFALQCAAVFALTLGVVVYAGRSLARVPGLRAELARTAAAREEPGTARFLARAKPIHLDYWVTGKERMPPSLGGVETEVRRLLEALRAAAPGAFDYRVLDPELGGPTAVAQASGAGAAPFNIRKIERDEESEVSVWSTLTIRYGPGGRALIPAIMPDTIPYLQRLILAQLAAMERPPRPVFGVAGPATGELKRLLQPRGELVALDLAGAPRIPPEIDLLFWLDPAPASAALRREFHRFVASGGTAVLAGGAYALGFERDRAGRARYRAEPAPEGAAQLLGELGVRVVPDLLIDPPGGWTGRLEPGATPQVPFILHVPPNRTDFRGFRHQGGSFLRFTAPSPIEFDSRVLAKLGYRAEIVASTSEKTRALPAPKGGFGVEELAGAMPVGSRPLAVLLAPGDPLAGFILVLGGSDPLRDGTLAQPGFDQRPLLDNIVKTFARTQRLILARVDRPAPPPIPGLSAGRRLFWRLATVLLAPALLLAAAAALALRGAGGRVHGLPQAGTLGRAAAAAALLAAVGAICRPGAGRLDLTRERVHTPSPLARRLVSELGPGLRATLAITERARMPAAFKDLEGALLERLSGLGLRPAVLRPESLPDAERATLEEAGLRPFLARTVRDDQAVETAIWSGLLLETEGRRESVPELQPRNLGHLDFLAAAAARRLRTGEGPRLAVHSDRPRLSPAEALQYYQSQNMVAPGGSDPYGEMKTLLRNYGYRLADLDPDRPSLPEDAAALVWMQPRFRAGKMREQLSRYLARGGKAVAAMQHFNIQQRQYRGRGFDTVHWPQPQYQDLDPYLHLLGVEQVREVLMDRTRSQLDLDFQIHRAAAGREFDAQRVALPFLIRAVGAHFSTASIVTARLGDQLFIWGNRFALDEARLASLGLSARTLIATSERAWRFRWKGGWLPHAAFDPPADFGARQPLAVLVQGSFPPAKLIPDAADKDPMALEPAPKDAKPGELLLIGSSEMFRNGRLYLPGFRHDQFLLNAVAHLAHPPELAALQARESPVRSFPFLPPGRKLAYRLLCVWLAPALFLLYGTRRYAAGGRPALSSSGRPWCAP